jgi:tetratricopeptide (TPR) repeat protein
VDHDLGKYQEAAENFSQVIRLDPKNAKAYNNRGIAYRKLDKYQEAIEDYSLAIRLDPNNAEAYNNQGLAFLALGQFEIACTNFQKACELGRCKGLRWAEQKGVCR